MPSPEHHYQRRVDAPMPSPQLQAVITDLAAYHEVDLSQTGACFTFTQPEQDTHWLITNQDGEHIDVARCPVNDDFMVPDIDVVLRVTPQGWQTETVLYSAAAWQAYAKTTAEQDQPPTESLVDFPFVAFAAYVAQLIEAQAQAEQASGAKAVKGWLRLE
jgi:hypothetical protein